MNPDSPIHNPADDALEARIVSWVLGEASAFEVAELERLCEERPELGHFRRRTLELHDLLTESEAAHPDDAWKLPEEKRRALDDVLGQDQPHHAAIRIDAQKEQRIRHSGRRAILAIAACVVLTLVVLSMVPGTYQAETTIEVKPRHNPYRTGGGTASSSQFFGTEFEKIKSRNSLGSVVDKLDLQSRWGVDRESAIRRLGQSVVAENIRGTDLIRIQAREKDPALAKDIANEVTRSYKAYRSNLEARESDRQLSELNKALRDQEDKVEERRKVLATIVRTKGINYKGTDSFYGQSGVDEDQGAKNAQQIYHDLEQEKMQLESQLNSTLKYDADQLMIYASGLDKPDNIVRKIYPEYLESQRDLEKLKNTGLGEDHPSVVAAKEQVQQQKRQLDEGVVNLRATLKAQLDLANDRLKSVEVMKDETRDEAIKRGLDAQDYVDAKREFESDQELLQQMKLKQMGETISSRVPDQSIVIHEEAVTAEPLNPLRAAAAKLSGVFSDGNLPLLAARSSESAYEDNMALAMSEVPATPAAPATSQVAGMRENKPMAEATSADPFAGTAYAGKMLSARAAQKRADKSDYYRDEYDHARAELLNQIDSRWELAVPAESDATPKPSNEVGDIDEAAASEFPTLSATSGKSLGQDSEVLIEELSESLLERAQTAPEEAKRVVAKPAVKKPAAPVLMGEEIAAAEDPYSTFSLNISDASFLMAQAALAKGERPDPESIKVEQFYNAVDYGDPAPSAGEPVAATIEQSAHPLIPGRTLVRVALKTAAAGRAASQPLRLTLLIDQSGSMVREDRRAAMDMALESLSSLLTEKDSVNVIGFSRKPRLIADQLKGDKAGELAELIHQSASEGGTNLDEAIDLADQLAVRSMVAGAQNRIVLFTDGAANLGNADPIRLAEKVKVLRQKGIAFDIAGIAADDLNDELLAELSRNGNGRYYVVGKNGNDGDAFAKQLAGAFRPAAENVKVQVHFNPERVARYKLIGFEKDRLKTEDFRNDAVDAAELAAEEAGVAIYQVETLPEGKGELGEVSVRFRETASREMIERSWTMRHDSNVPALDRAAPSMQLATLAMLAAEKLKGGPLADAIDFKQLAETRENTKRYYGQSGRAGQVLEMLNALK